MATTIDITPDTDGMIRWLQHVQKTDPATAMRIILAGWPALTEQSAYFVLTNQMDLRTALTGPPKESVVWFSFAVKFLDDSDQDTVSMVLHRAFAGINLELVTKDGNIRPVRLKNAHHDNPDFAADFETDGALGASLMEFQLLNPDDLEPTGECLVVTYGDIVSLGVY